MGFFSNPGIKELPWQFLTSEKDLENALQHSNECPVLIFKHSTRCSISSMVLSRFSQSWNPQKSCQLYFLDLIAYRDVSNEIAKVTGIRHESPQVLVLKEGLPVYAASHGEINTKKIAECL